MGIKQDVIAEIFKLCKKRKDFVFDNTLAKEVCKKYSFGNPFDVTKLDDTSRFSQVLLKEDYFILHLGRGKHKFILPISMPPVLTGGYLLVYPGKQITGLSCSAVDEILEVHKA